MGRKVVLCPLEGGLRRLRVCLIEGLSLFRCLSLSSPGSELCYGYGCRMAQNLQMELRVFHIRSIPKRNYCTRR